jgi:hypothetical protein
MMVSRPIPDCDEVYKIFWDCRVTGLRVASGNVVVDNTVASSVAVGYVTDGDECEQEAKAGLQGERRARELGAA